MDVRTRNARLVFPSISVHFTVFCEIGVGYCEMMEMGIQRGLCRCVQYTGWFGMGRVDVCDWDWF